MFNPPPLLLLLLPGGGTPSLSTCVTRNQAGCCGDAACGMLQLLMAPLHVRLLPLLLFRLYTPCCR
jgi:hypothetical protein